MTEPQDSNHGTYDDVFDAAEAAQEAADTTGVSHHVRKERATGRLVVQPSEPVDGSCFLTVWGPAEPTTTDCHPPFPGHVRSYASNSCGVCGGMVEGAPSPDHLARARYLGADAALTSVIDHYLMSEDDARSILDDVDPAVLDRYPTPTLGEWEGACDQTLGMQLDLPRWDDAIAGAWEEGRDAVWSDALQATALRVLGDVPAALELEHANEATVAELRKAAGL